MPKKKKELFEINRAVSDAELKEFCAKYDIQLSGVYMKDAIPPLSVGNFIINLENSNQSGSHWTCFVCTKKGCVYFDSYGAPPPEALHLQLKRHYGTIPMNGWIIQSFKSNRCGWYCVGLFAYLKLHELVNKSLQDKTNEYINMFVDDTAKNDGILVKFLRAFIKTDIPERTF